MSERRGIKGLELWCRRVTEGYPGVKIENMTTAWRDGLAFCAIIHHFRPELIDFSKLNKDDIYYNNELAFTVAEKYLGIPALLEPEDMVEYTVPDRLSILTYLSQFYRVFVGSQGSPSRIVPKRPTSSAERGLVSPESTSPPTKVAIKSVGTPHRDPCAKCSLPVFIAERLNVGKLLYHRTCFRCARCNSQLTLANYYETETKNQFCCETCPDEETVKQSSDRLEPEAPESIIVRSLSDEEKSKVGLKKFTDEDDYSAQFEFALEDANLSKTSSLSSVQNSEFLSARSHFINSQIENFESDGETPPELPKSQPPDITDKKSHLERSENDIPNYLNKPYAVHNPNSEYVKDLQFTQPVDLNVNNSDSISVSNQLDAARLKLGKNKEIITKEEPSANEKSLSLVKSRMRLFEEEAKDSKVKEKTSSPPPQKSKNSFESFTAKNNNNTVKSPLSNKNTDDKVGRKGSLSSNFFGEKQKLIGNKTSVSSESHRNEEKGKRTVELRKPSEKPLGSYAFKPKNTNSKIVTAETASSTRVSLRQKNTNLQSDVIAEGEKKKSGVSALKNLFENSLDVPHDRTLNSPKVDIDENETREMSTDMPNFSETSGAPVDETVPTAQKLEDEPLDDVDDTNELNDYVVVTNSAEELTPPLQTVRTTELNTKEHADELARDSDVPSQSEDSKEFVDLSKVSDDINDVLHSVKKEEAKEENISHSDSLNAIIISSDSNSNDDVPDEVIEISDSVIEISDSSADVSPLKSQISSSTVEKSDKDDYPENLNPFSDGEDEEDDGKLQNNSSAKSLNPFDEEDDEEEEEEAEKPVETHPAHAKRIIKADKVTFDSPDIPEPLRKLYIQRISESNFPNSGSAATSLNFSEEDQVQQQQQQEMRIPTPKKRTKIKSDFKPFESPHADASEFKRIGENPFENDAALSDDASSLNLFEEDQETRIPTPKKRTKIKGDLKPEFKRIGENPFENDDDDDDDDEGETAQTEPRKLKMIHAPKISLNPFWSDDDDDDDDDEGAFSDAEHKNEEALAKSNKSKNAGKSPEPVPRKSNQGTVSSTSTSSSSASSGAQKKKSPAPKPPPSFTLDRAESPHSSLTSSPATSVQHSPRSTPKARKTKKAPLPPTSTPFLTASNIDDKPPLQISPVIIVTSDGNSDSVGVLNSAKTKEWENEKNVKDEVNRNRQSQYFSADDSLPPDAHYLSYPANKSTYGKWKRKKGPAPSRPIPQRRTIKSLPVAEIRGELDLIELQQQGLEKQGVRLEQIIRDRCEGPDSIQEDTVPIDVEDLILQLFEVVNEKNEICRRQAELMYLQRQQRLEEEHADVEYQIRCLMLQPEANKTDSDKAREEELINRLVEIVERRNEIIECLEMDRIREAEEDDSISNSMNSYASKRDEAKVRSAGEELHKKTKKKFKKEKKTKVKDVQLDVDKDIDESETSNTLSKKEKKKKKFAIF